MLLKDSIKEVQDAGNDYKTFPRMTYLLLIITGVAGLYIYSLLASIIINAAKIGGEYGKASSLFISYAFLFITLVLIIGFNCKNFIKSLKNYKSYIYGIAFGILLILVPMAYSNFVNLFYQSNISENESQLHSMMMAYPALSVIFIGIIGPVCEELIYRLGIFESIGKPRWIAYLVSIIVFALMHFQPTSENIINELINLPSYLLSGLILALAYDKCNIATSMTAHMINNLFSVIVFIISKSI